MKLNIGKPSQAAHIIPKSLLAVVIITSPIIVFAQTLGNVQNLFAFFLNTLNLYVVPIIFALAFVFFLIGIYRYFIAGGADEEKVKTGRQFLIWSLIGFFIMFSIWGLINLLVGSLQLASNTEPGLPQFTSAGTSSYSSNPVSSILGSLFGTSLGGTSSVTTPAGTAALVSGTTLYSSGVPYQVTGANTVQAVNGTCPASSSLGSFSLIGGTNTCTRTTSSNGSSSSSSSGGGLTPGSECTSNSQCSGNNVCDTTDGTCKPDGPGVFSCQSDTATPNADGTCSDGKEAVNQNGDQAPSDGSAGAGQSCAGNEDACSGNLTCNDSTGMCEAPNSTNSGQDDTDQYNCGDGTYSDTAADCDNANAAVDQSQSDAVPATGNTGS